MSVPGTRITDAERRALADRLMASCVLPDEDETDYLDLETALVADLAPRSAMERAIVADLVALEWEQRRLRAWVNAILRAETARRMVSALRGLPPGALDRRADPELLVQAWLNALPETRQDVVARIRGAGIDPNAIVRAAYESRIGEVRRFESDMRINGARRRRLLQDLQGLQARRRPEVADAEVIEG